MNLKALLISTIATATLALCVTAAAAARLSTSNQNFRVAWASLEFNEVFGSSFIRCPLTLEGSFHSATVAKTLGSLIGAITRASVIGANCRGGRMTALTETLPWHVTYEGFNGTLPNITSIRLLLIGLSLLIEFFAGSLCLMRSTATEPWEVTAGREAAGNLTEGTPNEAESIRLTNVSNCPFPSIRFSSSVGDGRITVLGSTTRIAVTLI